MTTSDRPSFTTLLDWVEGRLDPTEADQVAAADAETHELVEWIREFIGAAQVMPLATPPPDLAGRLRAAFDGFQRPGEGAAWTEATLLHDTRARTAAGGVRSGVDGLHLAFESDLGRLALEIVPAGPAQVDVRGLVVADKDPEVPGLDLAFLEGGILRRATRTGRDGRFEAEGVPSCVDELWLTAGATRVRVPLNLSGN